MSSATLTLLGFYQHCNRIGKNFFDYLQLPGEIDKDVLVAEILHEAGSYEVLYTDPDMMCNAVDFFSKKWQRTIEKWVEVEGIEYEPLDNYDRKEAWSDSLSSSESTSTSTLSSDSTSNSSTTDADISAFNTSTLQPDNSASVNAITAGEGKVDSKSQIMKNDFSKHHGRIHGNIGVMTTQAIYREQWDLVKDLNIYEQIFILFAREFTIPFSY